MNANQEITAFTRDAVKLVGKEVEDAIQSVLDKHGLGLDRRSGRFDAKTFTIKLELTASGADPAADDFKLLAPLYGLKAEDLGRKCTLGSGVYTITGIAPRRRKYPIIIEDANGKKRLATVLAIQGALRLQDQPGGAA